MDNYSTSFSAAGLDLYTQILTQAAIYLILRYANLPDTLSVDERAAIEAGIRRSLHVLLMELEAADAGAVERFKQAVPHLAGIMLQSDLN